MPSKIVFAGAVCLAAVQTTQAFLIPSSFNLPDIRKHLPFKHEKSQDEVITIMPIYEEDQYEQLKNLQLGVSKPWPFPISADDAKEAKGKLVEFCDSMAEKFRGTTAGGAISKLPSGEKLREDISSLFQNLPEAVENKISYPRPGGRKQQIQDILQDFTENLESYLSSNIHGVANEQDIDEAVKEMKQFLGSVKKQVKDKTSTLAQQLPAQDDVEVVEGKVKEMLGSMIEEVETEASKVGHEMPDKEEIDEAMEKMINEILSTGGRVADGVSELAQQIPNEEDIQETKGNMEEMLEPVAQQMQHKAHDAKEGLRKFKDRISELAWQQATEPEPAMNHEELGPAFYSYSPFEVEDEDEDEDVDDTLWIEFTEYIDVNGFPDYYWSDGKHGNTNDGDLYFPAIQDLKKSHKWQDKFRSAPHSIHGSRPRCMKSKIRRVLRTIACAVRSFVSGFLIPVLVGVAAGMTASLLGMLVGTLCGWVWVKLFQSSRRVPDEQEANFNSYQNVQDPGRGLSEKDTLLTIEPVDSDSEDAPPTYVEKE